MIVYCPLTPKVMDFWAVVFMAPLTQVAVSVAVTFCKVCVVLAKLTA